MEDDLTSTRAYSEQFVTAFEILVVHLPETKTCTGQLKMLLRLSDGQPYILAQPKVSFLYAICTKPDISNELLNLRAILY